MKKENDICEVRTYDSRLPKYALFKINKIWTQNVLEEEEIKICFYDIGEVWTYNK